MAIFVLSVKNLKLPKITRSGNSRTKRITERGNSRIEQYNYYVDNNSGPTTLMNLMLQQHFASC